MHLSVRGGDLPSRLTPFQGGQAQPWLPRMGELSWRKLTPRCFQASPSTSFSEAQMHWRGTQRMWGKGKRAWQPGTEVGQDNGGVMLPDRRPYKSCPAGLLAKNSPSPGAPLPGNQDVVFPGGASLCLGLYIPPQFPGQAQASDPSPRCPPGDPRDPLTCQVVPPFPDLLSFPHSHTTTTPRDWGTPTGMSQNEFSEFKVWHGVGLPGRTSGLTCQVLTRPWQNQYQLPEPSM